MPLPEHEVDKELISNMVKALLDWMGREYECFGSTTFRNENMNSGIEPDNCFYIQNQERVRGKQRLNLSIELLKLSTQTLTSPPYANYLDGAI